MIPIIALLATALAPAGTRGPDSTDFQAEIRTTAYGVPHVRAASLAGAAFGLGYAFARADLCTVAERWVTVRGERFHLRAEV